MTAGAAGTTAIDADGRRVQLFSPFDAFPGLVFGRTAARSPAFPANDAAGGERVLIGSAAGSDGDDQAAAGNRDFLPVPRLPALAILLPSPAFLLACRAGAILTAMVELALGVGALGLIPAQLTITLAVPVHLAFIAISPRRIVAFSAAALGLLLLATTHPLLPPVW